MSDHTITTATISGEMPAVGDEITFEGIYVRVPWWRRAAEMLRLAKPSPRELRRYSVTNVVGSQVTLS